MDLLNLLWLVPALPLLGAAVNAVLGPRAPKAAVSAVGVGAPLLSLLVALGCLWQYSTSLHPAPFELVLYPWVSSFGLDIAFLLDPLTAVRLFVVKASSALVSEEGVIAHCRRELTTYKVPKQVRFLDALPKSSVGKILRKDLRGMHPAPA